MGPPLSVSPIRLRTRPFPGVAASIRTDVVNSANGEIPRAQKCGSSFNLVFANGDLLSKDQGYFTSEAVNLSMDDECASYRDQWLRDKTPKDCSAATKVSEEVMMGDAMQMYLIREDQVKPTDVDDFGNRYGTDRLTL